MSVLRNLESKIAGLVEGTFGRVFRTEVRPVELARALVKEMDEHRTRSVAKTYVPNEFVVWLSPEDRERYEGVEREVGDELVAYLLEHARRERVALVTRPSVDFRTDERLGLGEFGIQARTVRPSEEERPAQAEREGGRRPQARAPEVEQGDHGRTMVYSASDRAQESLGAERRPKRGRAFLVAEGKRMPVGADGAVIGRSRECEIVLGDGNVSRRHAEIRPSVSGWTIRDLGSTNGVRVNGRDAHGAESISDGDELELGTVDARFEVS